MWIVCITSVRHVLTVNGYGGRQTKENEKSWCFKGWETLDYNIGYAKIPTAHGNDIAGTLAIIAAILCHYDGTALPHGWHSVATVMARPCQRR